MISHYRRRRVFAPALAPLFAVLASVAALAVAYVSQYGFDMHPCTMCYWQRIPYAGVIVLGVLAFVLRHKKSAFPKFLLWLSVLALFVGAGIAAFHAGVEWRWWEGPSTCSGGLDGALSLEELRAQIMGAPTVSCQDAAIRVLGLSMAGWNAIYSFFAALVLLGLLRRTSK